MPVVYASSWIATAAETALGPPRMTIRPGFNRLSSVATLAGMEVPGMSRIGPPSLPASGAPARASAKPRPLAMKATAVPAG